MLRATHAITRRDVLRAAASLFAAACSPAAVPTPREPSSVLGLENAVPANLRTGAWLVRDPAGHVNVDVDFADDPTAALPRVHVGDEAGTLARESDGLWRASVDVSALPPGPVRIEVVERLRRGDVVVSEAQATLSHALFVVWTQDHEGYDEPDAYIANVEAIAQQDIPLTILFHPRILLDGAVEPARRDAIVRWVRRRASVGDEVGLHLHMQFDFVRAAGVAPRSSPRWGVGVGGDGYDVPLTAYVEDEQRRLIDAALRLMDAVGLPRPTSFRGGGQFADARTLRTLAASRFSVDASAEPAGSIGALRLPWTLPLDARPYRPSASDANVEDTNGLALLEVPTNAGNTYRDDVAELRRRQGVLWPGRAPLRKPVILNYVSHPSTFDAFERSKVEATLAPLLAARADRDAGPVRFVTLAEVERLWR